MADDDTQDESQKTEDPTQKRLDDAHKKGQVAFSREVNNLFLLFTFTIIIGWFSPWIFFHLTSTLTPFISAPHELFNADIDTTLSRMEVLFYDILKLVLLPFVVLMLAAILSAIIQNGLIYSFEPIIPKLEKISVLKGVKRLFSARSMVEFLKGIFKITIVGFIAFASVWPDLDKVQLMHDTDIATFMALLFSLALRMLVGVCVVMAFIAILDLIYQKFEFTKSMRMSKQDIKDEFKQTEGNPEIKAKLKSIRMERAQRRMMSAVPNADVIITNPTHYSIALAYEASEHNAPVVVAKGQDNIAMKIREIAQTHDIPLVSNPPLARALYTVELDEEIPIEHYQAVAEVISYVYSLKGKKSA